MREDPKVIEVSPCCFDLMRYSDLTSNTNRSSCVDLVIKYYFHRLPVWRVLQDRFGYLSKIQTVLIVPSPRIDWIVDVDHRPLRPSLLFQVVIFICKIVEVGGSVGIKQNFVKQYFRNLHTQYRGSK